MAKTSQRVFAMAAAILFLASSVAFSVFVFLQVRNQRQSTDTSNTINTNSSTQQPSEEKTDMLQGTKLDNFEPVSSVPELKIIDLEVGTGDVVPEGATVTAHYTGALAKDGTIFQSSHDFGNPIPFSLSGVIEGWQKGVPGMKVGGKRRLIIPAAMAYGDKEQTGIPANSDLVFDIELVKVGE